MSINRFISAAINRGDLKDSLVDAVIGLEGLFGGRAEIALSVAVGAAKLLGKSPVERRGIFESSKKVYGARSDLVHGNAMKVAKLDIPHLRVSALSLLRRCLLELLESRNDLLTLKAHERVKELVIE